MAPFQRKVVVGVDFGTTKTCVSYCFPDGDRPDNPTIYSWCPIGCSENIIPSVVSYTSDGSCLWGPEVSDEMDSLGWLKLLIEGPEERSNSRQIPRDAEFFSNIVGWGVSGRTSGRTPVHIISDFLKRLYIEFFTFLSGQCYGDVPPIEFWFTLPAMWSGTTRVRMFEAIEEAGFLARGMDKVHFVSEAESAACYYLRASGTSTPFEPGDVALVCDAGGGTTDFATFAIQSDLRCHQLQSAAIRCGAADVDYRLYKMMCRCLGVKTDELSDELRGPNGRLMKTIRKVKGNFSHEPLKVGLSVTAPNADRSVYNRQKRWFTFQPQSLQTEYRPVVNAILEELFQQPANSWNKEMPTASKILLTGGLSRSIYVRERFRQFLGPFNRELIECPCTEAVAHGAVCRGLFGGLSIDLWSDKHFGLLSKTPPPLGPVLQPLTTVPPMIYHPSWFLRKNEAFNVPHQGALTATICHRRADGPVIRIWICESDENGDPPAQVSGQNCQANRFITLNLSSTQLDYFTHQMMGGETFHWLDLRILWIIPANEPAIHFTVFALGEEIKRDVVRFGS